MRALFLILLATNLLFLAWAKWIDAPPDEGAHDSLARLPRLQLVSESNSGSKPTSDNSPLRGPPVAADVKGAASAPVGLEPAAAAVATSTLSATNATSQLPPAVATKVALLTAPSAPAVQTVCTSIGPFKDIASAARASGLLTERGLQFAQRAEEGESIEGYWVFVGGMQSDDEVNTVVARLEKSGFIDAHVMKNYSTNRRVSVGMFSTRDRAEKRAAAVKNMGLQPEIGERKFAGTIYWVDVTQPSEAGAKKKSLPPEYSFADVGNGKVGMQPCPTPVRAVAPLREASPGGDDGFAKGLPRTTVASAPLRVR